MGKYAGSMVGWFLLVRTLSVGTLPVAQAESIAQAFLMKGERLPAVETAGYGDQAR